MTEEQVREAIIAELTRQAEANPSALTVKTTGSDLTVDGAIDLDALAMAIVGSLAGGP